MPPAQATELVTLPPFGSARGIWHLLRSSVAVSGHHERTGCPATEARVRELVAALGSPEHVALVLGAPLRSVKCSYSPKSRKSMLFSSLVELVHALLFDPEPAPGAEPGARLLCWRWKQVRKRLQGIKAPEPAHESVQVVPKPLKVSQRARKPVPVRQRRWWNQGAGAWYPEI